MKALVKEMHKKDYDILIVHGILGSGNNYDSGIEAMIDMTREQAVTFIGTVLQGVHRLMGDKLYDSEAIKNLVDLANETELPKLD